MPPSSNILLQHSPVEKYVQPGNAGKRQRGSGESLPGKHPHRSVEQQWTGTGSELGQSVAGGY